MKWKKEMKFLDKFHLKKVGTNDSTGIIYPIVNIFINFLFYLNLVEIWKFLYTRGMNSKNKNLYIEAIDIFIIYKYIFICLVYFYEIKTKMIIYLIIYLIISNVFTYFYYHVWNKIVIDNFVRERRRFLSLILSIIFSNICFSYLYLIYRNHFQNWPTTNFETLEALKVSYMTIFGGTLNSNTKEGLLLISFNIVINFFFVVIILSNTNIEGKK